MNFMDTLNYSRSKTGNTRTPFIELQQWKKIMDGAKWMVTVPIITTMSEAELKVRGFYLDDYNSPKSNPVTDMTTVYLPLDRILSIWGEGHPVSFDKETMVSLAEHLEYYLMLFRSVLESALKNTSFPYDYVITISEFYNMLQEKIGNRKSIRRTYTVEDILDEVMRDSLYNNTEEEFFDYAEYFKRASVSNF